MTKTGVWRMNIIDKISDYRSSCEIYADRISETVYDYGEFLTKHKEEAEYALEQLKELENYMCKLYSDLDFEIRHNDWGNND